MPRRLRFIADHDTLVEVTCRVIQGRLLLTPSPRLNEIIVGALGRGRRRYGVRICAAVYLSNHAHLLLRVDDARQLARFMGFVNSKIAREIGRAGDWSEKVWGRRYTAIAVSTETAAQVARLRYLLSHGVKEHLVARCSEWPGVHCASSLVEGQALSGVWFDRSAQYRARLRGEDLDERHFAEAETLRFDRLPCWQHLDGEQYRRRIADIVADVEATAAAARLAEGTEPLGTEAIVRQDPRARPAHELERSPAPFVHAATKAVRRAFVDAYRWFEAAFRSAAEKLRSGERNVVFPDGCFPPPSPFVELPAAHPT